VICCLASAPCLGSIDRAECGWRSAVLLRDTRTTLEEYPRLQVLPACFARIAPELFIVRCGRSATGKATIREHAQRGRRGDHEHEPLVRSNTAVRLTGLSA
jgi:hypothetical protein